MYTLSSFVLGIIFGLGLVISNMINPTKVQNFLDVTGYWDPSLILVMISAVIITLIGFHFVKRRKKPVLNDKFHYPKSNSVTPELIIGSALFGIGWGITGYCPGPAISVLGNFQYEVLYFIAGMILGSLTYYGVNKMKKKG